MGNNCGGPQVGQIIDGYKIDGFSETDPNYGTCIYMRGKELSTVPSRVVGVTLLTPEYQGKITLNTRLRQRQAFNSRNCLKLLSVTDMDLQRTVANWEFSDFNVVKEQFERKTATLEFIRATKVRVG